MRATTEGGLAYLGPAAAMAAATAFQPLLVRSECVTVIDRG